MTISYCQTIMRSPQRDVTVRRLHSYESVVSKSKLAGSCHSRWPEHRVVAFMGKPSEQRRNDLPTGRSTDDKRATTNGQSVARRKTTDDDEVDYSSSHMTSTVSADTYIMCNDHQGRLQSFCVQCDNDSGIRSTEFVSISVSETGAVTGAERSLTDSLVKSHEVVRRLVTRQEVIGRQAGI
ncbi:unnamed protein product [Soboliphyme baturini]|uniref:Uncharacterized protein n=1 Tax=Soboliphyme baturini TaxID=241478 RepID=A0A183J506_9BILA|nr:unnamed protein product [Soboliphyme baturini]